MLSLAHQVTYLFLLALPIACIAWTVTHEEVFREPREFCINKSKNNKFLLSRKFFYLFTCEYCFSHYVTIFFLAVTNFQLLYPDWRGYLIAGFALVWLANIYMSLFGLVRVGLKKEKIVATREEVKLEKAKEESTFVNPLPFRSQKKPTQENKFREPGILS